MENIWVYGATRVGKSYWARHSADGLAVYPKEKTKWWCGYKGEPVVVIDDVQPEHADFLAGALKIWADTYPFMAENKGGGSLIRPQRIIVTSNYRLDEVFFRPGDREPLHARFLELWMKGRDDNGAILEKV